MRGMRRLRSLLRSESGQDLLEYGMLVSLIAILCYVAVENAGGAVYYAFDGIRIQLSGLPTGVGS